MKKFILLIVIIINLIYPSFGQDYRISKDNINATSSILIEANTGQILFDKNIHKKLNPASTTKLLTALLIVKDCNLEDIITVDKDSPFTKGSRIYIEQGERLTVRQMLNALLIESANDVALSLAKHHSGSVKKFTKEMNDYAKSLGALNSNFVNPNGLHNENHYSTAFDLSLIAKQAYKNDTIRSIVKKVRYSIPPTNKVDETRYLHTSNKFLYSQSNNYLLNYRGEKIFAKSDIINGMKTGYTPEAGNCLIASAKTKNKELISVVLNSQGRNLYIDSKKLLDYGFNEFQLKHYYNKNDVIKEIQLNNFKKSKIKAITNNSVEIYLPKNYNITNLSTEIIINKINLPINANEKIGSFNIYYKDNLLTQVDLISNIKVNNNVLLTKKTTYFDKEKNEFDFKLILNIFLKLIISFIIWRTLITFIRIRLEKI
ncbi:MAG: D-alanyl-D-alanine carboxypeptidase family protein [Bacillota bacterium]